MDNFCKKTLVYHIWVPKVYDDFATSLFNIHMLCLKHYIHIFNDAIFVISMEDITDKEKIKNIEDKILNFNYCGNITFKIIENNPHLREAETFKSEILDNLNNIDGIVFFGHTKSLSNGIKNYSFNEDYVRRWVMGLYYFNLENIEEVLNNLLKSRCITYGSFLTKLTNGENFVKNGWCYSGSFMWIHPKNFIAACKQENVDYNTYAYNRLLAETYIPTLWNYDKYYYYIGTYNNIVKENNGYYYYQDCVSTFYDGEVIKKFEKFYDLIFNSNNLDIFICSHKDPVKILKHDSYKIICGEKDDITVNMPIIREKEDKLQKTFCEISRILWVYKNIDLKKYVGFCHYRAFYDFYDDIPDIDNIFTKNDIIIGCDVFSKDNNIYFRNGTKAQYEYSHNIDDYNEIEEIILKHYPNYSKTLKEFDISTHMLTRNMFIMKKEDFKHYCKFIETIIFDFIKNHNFHDMNDVREYINKSQNKFGDRKDVEYQERLIGFLCERLTNIFIIHNFSTPYAVNINVF